MTAVDLGCGSRKRPGTIGVDLNPASGADVIHDLNVQPYPFGESTFDEVYLDNVLEHLDNVIAVMEEVHRISRDGGIVRVDVPYFRSRWAAIDPTHKHAFTVESFGYFDPDHAFFEQFRYSSTAAFAVERVVFNERWPMRGTRAKVARWASRAPTLYEARISHLFPLDELTFFLRTRKR